MDFIQSWVHSIATATLIIAVVSALCPKNSAGRAVGLIGGIIMTAVLVGPMKSLDVSVLDEYTARYTLGVEEKSGKLLKENEILRKNIIEENTRAYILQRAASKGIACDVRIECKEDVPHSAHIIAADEEKVRLVAELIESECGIPETRRTYKIEV